MWQLTHYADVVDYLQGRSGAAVPDSRADRFSAQYEKVRSHPESESRRVHRGHDETPTGQQLRLVFDKDMGVSPVVSWGYKSGKAGELTSSSAGIAGEPSRSSRNRTFAVS
jgi:hypothetical protein